VKYIKFASKKNNFYAIEINYNQNSPLKHTAREKWLPVQVVGQKALRKEKQLS
jgi:hypothetical protein